MRKYLFIILAVIFAHNCFSQTLRDTCAFDFTSPIDGGFTPAVTPSTINGSSIDVTGKTFTSYNGHIQIYFEKDTAETHISPGVRVETILNSNTNKLEYYLSIASYINMYVSCPDGAMLDSIKFTNNSVLGGLRLLDGQPGEIVTVDGENGSYDRKWTAKNNSSLSNITFRNAGTTSSIYKIVFYYRVVSNTLQPTSLSISNGAIVETFNGLTLNFSDNISLKSSSGITATYNNETKKVSASTNGKDLILTLNERLTEDGTVKIDIPSGCIENSNGYTNKALSYTYYISVARNTFNYISSSPATNTTIEKLPTTITLNFEKPKIGKCIGYIDNTKTIRLYKEGYNEPITYIDLAVDDTDDSKLILTLRDGQEMTVTGNYTITIPEKTIFNRHGQLNGTTWEPDDTYGKWNEETTLTFIVSNESTPSETLLKAQELIQKTGVGFPSTSSESYIKLKNLIESNASDEELITAINAYYEEETVTLPTTGNYYKIASVNKSGSKLYLAYENNAVTLTSDTTKAAAFLATTNSDNTSTFATTDGKYLHVLTASNEYDVTSSANVTSEKGIVNNLTVAKLLVDSTDAEAAFGLVSIYGYLGKKTNDLDATDEYSYSVVQHPIGSLVKSNEIRFTDTYTCAFSIIETTKPDTTINTIDLIPELTQDKDSEGNITLTLDFSNTDNVITISNVESIYVESSSGIKSSVTLQTSASSTNIFMVNAGNLSAGNYTLVIPENTLNIVEGNTVQSNSLLEVPFAVEESSNEIDLDDADFQETYNKCMYLLSDEVIYDTDLNNFILYYDKTSLYGYDMAPSTREVLLTEVNDASAVIRKGVFERCPESELPSGTVGLKLQFTSGDEIEKGELKTGSYTFIFKRATWGDANFAKYLEDPNSVNASECKVNPSMHLTFYVDNDKATGINDIQTDNESPKVIYDLSGRRLKKITEPGLYIINGKKKVIKKY